MGNADERAKTTRLIRLVARIWSLPVIAFTLFMTVAHIVGAETETADYPPIENLLPLTMVLSVAGLGVAWRWEGIGGVMNVGLYLAMLLLYWAIKGRFFPFRGMPIFWLAVIPGVLFMVCWWRERE